MHLYDLPMICILAGLALYAVLGGADFGAGLWQLASVVTSRGSRERRSRGERIREHAHHSMGPVWEANHVWLIFVLTVTWTAYPSAFGAIASTLVVPLFIAGLGVVFRGAAYALRAGTAIASELGAIDTVFSLSSILTPFALGTIVGAIASQSVPRASTTVDAFSSWLSPLSILVGLLAVATSAYLAAVYLAADAARHHDAELVEAFRRRALLAGVLAGAVAIGGLPLLHAEAHRTYTRLTDGPGLVGLAVSLLAGVATLTLVARRRFEEARVSAALAVVGTIVGWALAQQPLLLSNLTIAQAAASRETLIALLAAIAVGAAILFPSLGLLFSLLLRGRFDDAPETSPAGPDTAAGSGAAWPGAGAAPEIAASPGASAGPGGDARSGLSASQEPGALLAAMSVGLYSRLALAGLLGGLGLLTVAEAPWAHAIGVACLFACVIFGFLAVAPAELAADTEEETRADSGA